MSPSTVELAALAAVGGVASEAAGVTDVTPIGRDGPSGGGGGGGGPGLIGGGLDLGAISEIVGEASSGGIDGGDLSEIVGNLPSGGGLGGGDLAEIIGSVGDSIAGAAGGGLTGGDVAEIIEATGPDGNTVPTTETVKGRLTRLEKQLSDGLTVDPGDIPEWEKPDWMDIETPGADDLTPGVDVDLGGGGGDGLGKTAAELMGFGTRKGRPTWLPAYQLGEWTQDEIIDPIQGPPGEIESAAGTAATGYFDISADLVNALDSNPHNDEDLGWWGGVVGAMSDTEDAAGSAGYAFMDMVAEDFSNEPPASLAEVKQATRASGETAGTVAGSVDSLTGGALSREIERARQAFEQAGSDGGGSSLSDRAREQIDRVNAGRDRSSRSGGSSDDEPSEQAKKQVERIKRGFTGGI